MTKKTFQGATVSEAVKLGLDYFKLTEDEVKVDVKDSGSKGFLGFGKRPASVEITILQSLVTTKNNVPEIIEEAIALTPNVDVQQKQDNELNEKTEADKQESIRVVVNYLKNIAHDMGIDDLEITTKEVQLHLFINLHTHEAGRLIGKRGNTLNALQQLAQIVYMNHLKQFAIVELDIEGYRELRTQTLEELAFNMAKKAKQTRRPVKLEPMPAYERKVVHKALANIENITTRSEGKEPYRHLVIQVK